jgi:ribosomal protein L31
MDTQLACACCSAPMQTFRCQHKVDGELTLDLCFDCHSIWFDKFESLQMAPSGVLELFRLIHEHRDDARQPWREVLKCPRCDERLVQCFDVCKNGKFSYHRCLNQHGRFTGFSALMMEKGFVRQLDGEQIEALAQKIQIVRCSACGAPIDIRTQTVCGYCHAPIAILDPQSVEKALGGLAQSASREKHVDPIALVDGLLVSERLKWESSLEQAKAGRMSALNVDHADLATHGLALIWTLLNR